MKLNFTLLPVNSGLAPHAKTVRISLHERGNSLDGLKKLLKRDPHSLKIQNPAERFPVAAALQRGRFMNERILKGFLVHGWWSNYTQEASGEWQLFLQLS